jgi:hypothetical protein
MSQSANKHSVRQRGGHTEPKPKSHESKHQTSLDDKLEQGLEESFPGSDPVSITQPPASQHDKNRS